MNSSITSRNNPVVKYVKRNLGILAALLIIVAAIGVTSEYFFTAVNLTNLFRQMTTNALLAFGMTFCLIIGCIDLSVGSYIGLSGIVTARMLSSLNAGFGVALVGGVLACVLCGLVSGLIVAQTGMPAFIVTLAMQNIARGAAYLLSDGVAVKVANEAFFEFGNGYVFSVIPIPVVIFTAIGLFLALLLNNTVFGRHMYAIGGNSEAAMFVGVNIKQKKVLTFIISAALAGIAGVITASRVYSGQPTAGTGFESDAIAAAVLGGTSFSGGRGTIGGTVIGVFVIAVISNGLNLLEVSTYWQMIAKGVIIVLAVYSDTLKQRRKPPAGA